VLREKAPNLEWVDSPVDQSIRRAAASGARLLEMMMASPEFDVLVANVGENWGAGRPDAIERMAHLVDRFAAIGVKSRKPTAFVLGPADSSDETKWRAVSGGQQRLADARLAVYPSVDRAASALAWYAQWQSSARRRRSREQRSFRSSTFFLTRGTSPRSSGADFGGTSLRCD
jgi:hypothetical protein